MFKSELNDQKKFSFKKEKKKGVQTNKMKILDVAVHGMARHMDPCTMD